MSSKKEKIIWQNVDYTLTFMRSVKEFAAGSGEKMRKAGAKGRPTAKQFTRAAKTAKKR